MGAGIQLTLSQAVTMIDNHIYANIKNYTESDYNNELSINSQSHNDKVLYRADIGYIYTGPWCDRLDEAIIGLAEML